MCNSLLGSVHSAYSYRYFSVSFIFMNAAKKLEKQSEVNMNIIEPVKRSIF